MFVILEFTLHLLLYSSNFFRFFFSGATTFYRTKESSKRPLFFIKYLNGPVTSSLQSGN